MSQEIFIGIVVIVSIALLLGVKTWIHRVLAFKMDESSIVNFFKESSDALEYASAEVISARTDISISRVIAVCAKSQVLQNYESQKSGADKAFWCLK